MYRLVVTDFPGNDTDQVLDYTQKWLALEAKEEDSGGGGGGGEEGERKPENGSSVDKSGAVWSYSRDGGERKALVVSIVLSIVFMSTAVA